MVADWNWYLNWTFRDNPTVPNGAACLVGRAPPKGRHTSCADPRRFGAPDLNRYCTLQETTLDPWVTFPTMDDEGTPNQPRPVTKTAVPDRILFRPNTVHATTTTDADDHGLLPVLLPIHTIMSGSAKMNPNLLTEQGEQALPVTGRDIPSDHYALNTYFIWGKKSMTTNHNDDNNNEGGGGGGGGGGDSEDNIPSPSKSPVRPVTQSPLPAASVSKSPHQQSKTPHTKQKTKSFSQSPTPSLPNLIVVGGGTDSTHQGKKSTADPAAVVISSMVILGVVGSGLIFCFRACCNRYCN